MSGGGDGVSGWSDEELEEDEEMEEDSTSNVVEGHGTLITDTGNGTVKEDPVGAAPSFPFCSPCVELQKFLTLSQWWIIDQDVHT
jgi:hypothetical protein